MWSIGVLTGTTSYKGQFRSVRSCRTFEPAMLKGHGTMDNAREHHAGRAARTARALDGCEGWTGGKISSWHDTSLHLGGSVQHSLSPIDAYAWAVIEPACASEFRGRWSILLTFRNLIDRATKRNGPGAGAATGPSMRRSSRSRHLTRGCHRTAPVQGAAADQPQ